MFIICDWWGYEDLEGGGAFILYVQCSFILFSLCPGQLRVIRFVHVSNEDVHFHFAKVTKAQQSFKLAVNQFLVLSKSTLPFCVPVTYHKYVTVL